MIAMLIIADTSLDGMMEALPPKGDPLGTSGPHGVTLPDGRTVIPKCWMPRLVCGPVEVVDWTSDSLRKRLNDLLGTDSEWMFYLSVGRDGHSIWDLLFVYRYLSRHDGTIGLYSELNQPLSPEVPVARIDVSTKGPGMKPLTLTPKSDVLCLFTDSSRTASGHDTAILDRTRRVEEGHRGCWTPSDGITLGKLMGICGNAVANYTVYGTSQYGKQVSAEPVEVVTDLPVFWEHKGEWKGPLRSRGVSVHADRRVMRYGLYGMSGQTECFEAMGVRGHHAAFDNETFGMAVVVDLGE